ncbi:MAG: DCC1-like thiol-disulfide oxidoreductase family protein [Haloarculaceae archaeon]
MAPPRLVYDDDCGFCTWATRVALHYGAFEAVGFSDLTPDQRARLPDDYERCAHLLTDDAVYSCGAAAERTLERMVPALAPLFGVCRRSPTYVRFREWLYRLIADNRDLLGRIRSASPPA